MHKGRGEKGASQARLKSSHLQGGGKGAVVVSAAGTAEQHAWDTHVPSALSMVTPPHPTIIPRKLPMTAAQLIPAIMTLRTSRAAPHGGGRMPG